MAKERFVFKGLVTPHNAYCQTRGGGGGGLPLLFWVRVRSNKHLVVSKLDMVNVSLVRQKTLWCVSTGLQRRTGNQKDVTQEKKQKKRKVCNVSGNRPEGVSSGKDRRLETIPWCACTVLSERVQRFRDLPLEPDETFALFLLCHRYWWNTWEMCIYSAP